jgi:hypothetical protein
MAKVSAEPSEKGRDDQIHRLALQLNIAPSPELVAMARASWIEATKQWRHGRGPKPDVAKCIAAANVSMRRAGDASK